jgi:hypothetical protein
MHLAVHREEHDFSTIIDASRTRHRGRIARLCEGLSIRNATHEEA